MGFLQKEVSMMKIDKHFLIVSGITFGVFFLEALIHYNYGIFETLGKKFNWDDFINHFKIPKGKSLAKMASIVVFASAISGLIIDKAEESF